jgi:hypothetical protein
MPGNRYSSQPRKGKKLPSQGVSKQYKRLTSGIADLCLLKAKAEARQQFPIPNGGLWIATYLMIALLAEHNNRGGSPSQLPASGAEGSSQLHRAAKCR